LRLSRSKRWRRVNQERYDAKESFTLEDDGHYHLYVPAFYEFDGYANHEIDFIFDTGAYLTVIARSVAKRFGFLDRFIIRAC